MARVSARAIDQGVPGPVPLGVTFNLLSSRAALFAAFRDRLTWQVIVLLCMAAIISITLIARQHGAREPWQRTGVACYVVLVCLAVYVIIDLNQPEKGLVRIDSRPLERVATEISR